MMWILIILIMAGALFIPMFLSSDSNIIARYSLRKYHEGQLCPEDVFATTSFTFVDKDKTTEMQNRAQKNVLPTFSYSLNNTLRSTNRMNQFLDAWNIPTTATGTIKQMLDEEGLSDTMQVAERYAELSSSDRKKLLLATRETMQLILKMGIYRSDDITSIQKDGYGTFKLVGMEDYADSMKSQDVSIDQCVTKDTLEKNLSDWLNSYTDSIKGFQLVLLEDTIRLLATENVLYDENTTVLERKQAMEETPKVQVTIMKGQKILTKDTVITKSQLALLQELAKHRSLYSVSELVGRTVFIVVITFACILVFLTFIPNNPRKYQYLQMSLLLVLVVEIGNYFLCKWAQASPYEFQDTIVPYIVAPLFVSLISGKKRLGAVTSFLVSSYVQLLPNMSIMANFTCLFISSVCVYFFQYANKKIDNLFHWLYACISSLFIEVAFLMLVGESFSEMLPLMGALLANITLSYFFVNLLLSACEAILNLPTASRLDELAFTDSPVLDRLAASALGTYNHSMNVSEIAFDCAKAIGANAMLARVGGMYHDIGKAEYPEYFVENQGEENKQDDIKPSLSVAIIKSHVKTGIEKGREAGLPQEVLDIIGEHHGNDIIQFFYRKAQDIAGDEADLVDKSDYRYDGKLPDSKEAAIVMLSDCVEAASHTVKRPSPTRYEKLVHAIILGKIEREQLSNSQLSLTDIDIIKKTMTKDLVGKNHHRIEYPSDKEPAQGAEGATQEQSGAEAPQATPAVNPAPEEKQTEEKNE